MKISKKIQVTVYLPILFLISCSLHADIFDVFAISEDPKNTIVLPIHIKPDFYKQAHETLSEDVQILLAQQLLKTAFNGNILWTTPAVKTLRGHILPVFSVAFSPDGKQLASGSFDSTIKLWDVATGTNTQTLTGHTSIVYSVAFNPNGKQLASGWGYDIKLWTFKQPILSNDEWNNLTLEQAFFLILLFSKRPTFNQAAQKPIDLGKLHEKLTREEAERIWHSFSQKTQSLIKHRYNIIQLTLIDQQIAAEENKLRKQYEADAFKNIEAYKEGRATAQKIYRKRKQYYKSLEGACDNF